MSTKHWLLIGGCLSGLSAMVSAMPTWNQASTPAFVGGAVGVIAAQIIALFSDKPHR